MKEYHWIETETHGRVGLVTLNRPQALNALSPELMGEVVDALECFDSQQDIGAMVLAGSEKSFAAGADISFMVEASPVEMLQSSFIPSFEKISQLRKPLLAAVSGYCLGGGNELALSCDLIIASETAQFGQPEINLGVIPGAGGTQRLTRAVDNVS